MITEDDGVKGCLHTLIDWHCPFCLLNRLKAAESKVKELEAEIAAWVESDKQKTLRAMNAESNLAAALAENVRLREALSDVRVCDCERVSILGAHTGNCTVTIVDKALTPTTQEERK